MKKEEVELVLPRALQVAARQRGQSRAQWRNGALIGPADAVRNHVCYGEAGMHARMVPKLLKF